MATSAYISVRRSLNANPGEAVLRVLAVGGGNAGQTSAIKARNAGASVLLIAKEK